MISVTYTSLAHPGWPEQRGLTVDFLEREIDRVGASVVELRSAVDFVGRDVEFDPRAYEALSPRMRRLVDLVTVAGHAISTKVCESPQMNSAA